MKSSTGSRSWCRTRLVPRWAISSPPRRDSGSSAARRAANLRIAGRIAISSALVLVLVAMQNNRTRGASTVALWTFAALAVSQLAFIVTSQVRATLQHRRGAHDDVSARRVQTLDQTGANAADHPEHREDAGGDTGFLNRDRVHRGARHRRVRRPRHRAPRCASARRRRGSRRCRTRSSSCSGASTSCR